MSRGVRAWVDRGSMPYSPVIQPLKIGPYELASPFELMPYMGVGLVAGLALSFGAQSLVKDMIAGFFILLENQFAVGDVIMVESTQGKVERMTLRVVMLRDASGVLHIIPNGSITRVSRVESAVLPSMAAKPGAMRSTSWWAS